MSACNHAISSARTTMESLFYFKASIGLGIAFPFKFAAQEEKQIIVATPPNSCSRATFCSNSSSFDSLPSSSLSVSPSLCCCSSKSRLYKGIGLGHPTSRGTPLDEAALPASKRSSIANTGALPTECQGKLPSSDKASDPDFKEYTGVNLRAPPTIKSKGRDLGVSPQWSERNVTSDMPSTSPPVLPRFSSTIPEPRQHLHRQPAGLGLGHPTTTSLQTASLAPPPPPPSEPSGMGMLTSSLSISFELSPHLPMYTKTPIAVTATSIFTATRSCSAIILVENEIRYPFQILKEVTLYHSRVVDRFTGSGP